MGKVYKDKKSKGCALCKPHKHGWAPKKKEKVRIREKELDGEVNEAYKYRGRTSVESE
jgi:hypothetical protein